MYRTYGDRSYLTLKVTVSPTIATVVVPMTKAFGKGFQLTPKAFFVVVYLFNGVTMLMLKIRSTVNIGLRQLVSSLEV